MCYDQEVMRVISMVPSWTETLIESNVDVVGRTRFCIHPKDKIAHIPVVGGTKDIKVQEIQNLKPDILILDKEENPIRMSELGFPYYATHVSSIHNVAGEVSKMSEIVQSLKLKDIAERWERCARKTLSSQANLPVLEWLTSVPQKTTKVFYIIWRNPWMVVSNDTFIGSMMTHLGYPLLPFANKYPEIHWEEMNQPGHLLLFSSEPFPFLKRKSVIPELKASAAIVDGERLSWFGVRSLRYLESL